MMRLDFETITPITAAEEEQLISWLEALCQRGLQGIVISDYGKGVCTPTLLQHVFKLANTYQVQTIVDPKGADWSKYDGATCITPNVKELGESLGRVIPMMIPQLLRQLRKYLIRLILNILLVLVLLRGLPLWLRMVELGIIQQHNRMYSM